MGLGVALTASGSEVNRGEGRVGFGVDVGVGGFGFITLGQGGSFVSERGIHPLIALVNLHVADNILILWDLL